MADVVTITLNGVEKAFRDLGPNPSINNLVAALGFREDRVALERNGEIVTRAQWPTTYLIDQDRIELVHFVGGGRGN